MRFSIVTPIYNTGINIRRCVESVTKQTLSDWEWIFVDDCSTDNSIDVVKDVVSEFSIADKVRFLKTEKNSGPGEARNVGLRTAQGKYIVFIDSDDWIEPDYLETLYLSMGDTMDFSYCQAKEHNGDAEKLLINPHYTSQKQLLCSYVGRIWTCMFRTSFLRENNIEFPPYRAAEDSAFFAACIVSTDKIASVEKTLYHYVIYSQSVSHKFDPYKTQQKKSSFRWLMKYAKDKGVWSTFMFQLSFIYIKKALIVPCVDKIKSWL